MIGNGGASLARSELSAAHDGSRPARDKKAARRQEKEQLQILGSIRPFGIYRRMESDAYDSFVATTLLATREAGMWLRETMPKGTQPEIKMNGDFGVTFLGFQSMRNALVDAIKEERLDVETLVDELGEIESPPLEVPFSHFEWGGNGRRRLLARYTLDTLARQTLDEQRQHIDAVLDRHHIARTPLEPDHTSVVRVAPVPPLKSLVSQPQKCDRRKRRTRTGPETPEELTNKQRHELATIFHDTFIRRGIGSVSLGPLVIGTSYSKPLRGLKPLDVKVSFSNDF